MSWEVSDFRPKVTGFFPQNKVFRPKFAPYAAISPTRPPGLTTYHGRAGADRKKSPIFAAGFESHKDLNYYYQDDQD
jgi:hypothetical protein